MYKQILSKNVVGDVIVCSVQRISDKAFIPFDEQNIDYQEYLKWCSEGNQPEPADEDTQ
jgi:hypothetical protein